jgi:hypothetical protein
MRCTPPPCMSLPCSSMLCIAPPPSSVAGPALRSGLTTSQVPPRPSLPRSPPSAHARTARVLGPHRAAAQASGSALFAPGRLPPLGSRSCTRTLTPPAARTPSHCRTALCSHFCLPCVCSCFQRALCSSLCVSAATARFNTCSCPHALPLWRLPRSRASAGPEPAPAPALQRAPPALHRASSCAHSDCRSHMLGFLAHSPALARAHSVPAACPSVCSRVHYAWAGASSPMRTPPPARRRRFALPKSALSKPSFALVPAAGARLRLSAPRIRLRQPPRRTAAPAPPARQPRQLAPTPAPGLHVAGAAPGRRPMNGRARWSRGKEAGGIPLDRGAAGQGTKKCQGEDKAERERKNRGEREKELPKDLCVILENCRDLFVKHKFHINLKPE